MPPEPGPATPQIAIYEVADAQAAGVSASESLRITGVRLFRLTYRLIIGVLIALAIYAFLTYPRTDQLLVLIGEESPVDRLAAYEAMRRAWFDELIEIVQVLLIGPFVPLLTAIVGYIFGSSGVSNDDDS